MTLEQVIGLSCIGVAIFILLVALFAGSLLHPAE